MSGELIFNEVAAPSSPAASKEAIYATNDVPSRLARKDSAGNVFYMDEKYIIALTADYTMLNQTAAQKAFNSPANGTITVPSSTSYRFMACYEIANTGVTSHAWQVAIGGTATFTSAIMWIQGNNNATAPPATGGLFGTTATVGTLVTATPALASADTAHILLDGILRVNAGGTIIPQIGETGPSGTAPVMKANSFFVIHPFGSNTAASLGPWS